MEKHTFTEHRIWNVTVTIFSDGEVILEREETEGHYISLDKRDVAELVKLLTAAMQESCREF